MVMTCAEIISRRIHARHVGRKGRHIRLDASVAQCAALCDLHRLGAIDFLRARFTLLPLADRAIEVTGRFDARLTQYCVITLAPMPKELHGKFMRHFVPARAQEAQPRKEVFVHIDEDDPPDVMTDNYIDTGAILCEEFALALDLYPRMHGADRMAEKHSSAIQAMPNRNRRAASAGQDTAAKRDAYSSGTYPAPDAATRAPDRQHGPFAGLIHLADRAGTGKQA